MACTCRNPARCPICNTPVRVPLTNLENAAGGAILVDRFARRDSSTSREGLRSLIQGWASCPACGHTIHFEHSRSCVADALAAAGVPLGERESILAKITFPEG
ncbi:MAG TPA: hypothetical protein VMG81_06655 [Thermoplasmata archaeon]|nr:hypothetical protein [Thermoplasmata archaeon]